MSDPTKVIVYVAPQGTWLRFINVFGFPDALELSKPMRLVAEHDYATLAQALTLATQRAEAAEAERDFARVDGEFWKDMAQSMDQVRNALRAERDALRTVDDAMVGRFLRAYTECEDERPHTFTHRIGVRAALDAALAVQPAGHTRADSCCPCVARAAGGRRMSDPTKVIVYVAPQGTWLSFVDEDGVDDALDLSEPMRFVAERDYAKLAQDVATLRAERDALRDQWSGLLIEQARLMALRDEAIAERDALRKLLRMCARTCDTLDHGPGMDFHESDEMCPIVVRIDAALAVQP